MKILCFRRRFLGLRGVFSLIVLLLRILSILILRILLWMILIVCREELSIWRDLKMKKPLLVLMGLRLIILKNSIFNNLIQPKPILILKMIPILISLKLNGLKLNINMKKLVKMYRLYMKFIIIRLKKRKLRLKFLKRSM